jgi:hypothetical protein
MQLKCDVFLRQLPANRIAEKMCDVISSAGVEKQFHHAAFDHHHLTLVNLTRGIIQLVHGIII